MAMNRLFLFAFLSLSICLSTSFGQTRSGKKLVPNAGTIQGSAQATDTNTMSFTVPAGISRMLLVVVSDADALSVTNVTFGGTGMTLQASQDDGFAVDSVWTLVLGNSGTDTTQNIVVTSVSASASFIAATAMAGIDQTSPITDTQQAFIAGTDVGSTLNVASQDGDIVFDIFDTFDSTLGAESQTPGPSQTELHNVDALPVAGPGFAFYQTSFRTGAAPNVPMSWTSTNGAMIHIAVNVNGIGVTAAAVGVGGRVTTASGRGLPRAYVTISDPDGNVRMTTTNHFGHYRFADVEAGATYVLSASSKGVAFANPTQVIAVSDELSNVNFVALK